MQSLRRKSEVPPRAKANANIPASSGNKLQRSQSKDKTAQNARKSRVGDKIKRRMSMRYADISDPIGIPDVPALPNQMLRPTGEYSRQTFDEPEEEEEELLVDGRGNYYQNDPRTSGYVGPSGGTRRPAKRSVELDTEALLQSSFDPDAC